MNPHKAVAEPESTEINMYLHNRYHDNPSASEEYDSDTLLYTNEDIC